MNRILIKNATVVTLGEPLRILKNHALFLERGVIKKVLGNLDDLHEEGYETIDAKGRIVMPGFINTHMHFYSSFARGLNKADPSKNFSEVLENLWWRLDKLLSLEDCYYSTKVACIEAIKKGTTTIIDHHASPSAVRGSLEELARAVNETGLKANLCYELSDRDGEKISAEGIVENVEFIKNHKDDDNIKALFGMHASFTIDDATLEKVANEIDGLDTGIHIHTAEDIIDQKITIKKTGMRVVERLNRYNFLGPKTILGHCIHLNNFEIELIKNSNSIVVHNPQSNMNNAVGMANLPKLMDKGILVGLGTDSMTLNMLEELRVALWANKLAAKDPSSAFMECCNALVVNNAKIANRFWSSLGEIKEGNVADLVIMDYLNFTELTSDNFLGHLVFGISESSVDTTISNGVVLMKDKVLQNIDEKKVFSKAKECSKKLWSRF